MQALATTGTIGLHLVSGPLVGFGMGYGIDWLLGTHPWGKLVMLFVGIGAGFLNVYRDTQILLNKMNKQDARARAERELAEMASSADAAGAPDATNATGSTGMTDAPEVANAASGTGAARTTATGGKHGQ